jgi:hypothetical protein
MAMSVAETSVDESPVDEPPIDELAGLATAPVARACRNCAFFRNDAAYLERELEGLRIMGSGYASVRAEDGVCLRHDRYLSAWAVCGEFQARQANP